MFLLRYYTRLGAGFYASATSLLNTSFAVVTAVFAAVIFTAYFVCAFAIAASSFSTTRTSRFSAVLNFFAALLIAFVSIFCPLLLFALQFELLTQPLYQKAEVKSTSFLGMSTAIF